MSNSGIQVVLFDLGGVLVELDGPPLLPQWLSQELTELENWQSWARSPAVEAFESDKMTAESFAEQLISELNLKVSAEKFLERFKAWPKGLYPGAEALLSRLKPHYTLACYSNTSHLHWPLMMNDMKLEKYMDFAWASFQIQCYKPSREGFVFISNELEKSLGVSAENILFIDDNPANVEAAIKCGMKGQHARGLDCVRSRLIELEILPV